MQRRLSDGFDTRPFEPRAPILLASGTRRSSFLSSISYDATFISPTVRSTFPASPPLSAFRQRYGTRSQALSPGTSSAPGSLFLHSIATSPSVVSSALSTFTSARTRTTGTGRSTSSTESKWTHSSRAESRCSGFTGHMTMVTCVSWVSYLLPRRPCLSSFISGIFKTALPEFKALEEFEWIGYPELQVDMVQALLKTHPNLNKLGLMYLPPA